MFMMNVVDVGNLTSTKLIENCSVDRPEKKNQISTDCRRERGKNTKNFVVHRSVCRCYKFNHCDSGMNGKGGIFHVCFLSAWKILVSHHFNYDVFFSTFSQLLFFLSIIFLVRILFIRVFPIVRPKVLFSPQTKLTSTIFHWCSFIHTWLKHHSNSAGIFVCVCTRPELNDRIEIKYDRNNITWTVKNTLRVDEKHLCIICKTIFMTWVYGHFIWIILKLNIADSSKAKEREKKRLWNSL